MDLTPLVRRGIMPEMMHSSEVKMFENQMSNSKLRCTVGKSASWCNTRPSV